MAGIKSLTLAVAMAAFAFTGFAQAEDKGLVV
jgi:putative multiple sugar transport system substrate-binding protein